MSEQLKTEQAHMTVDDFCLVSDVGCSMPVSNWW